MRIGGWVLLVAGLLLGAYGKYFHDSPYRVYGIVVAMGAATLLLKPWRRERRAGPDRQGSLD